MVILLLLVEVTAVGSTTTVVMLLLMVEVSTVGSATAVVILLLLVEVVTVGSDTTVVNTSIVGSGSYCLQRRYYCWLK